MAKLFALLIHFSFACFRFFCFLTIGGLSAFLDHPLHVEVSLIGVHLPVDLSFYLRGCLSDLSHSLAYLARDLRDLLRPENDEYHGNDNKYLPETNIEEQQNGLYAFQRCDHLSKNNKKKS